MNDHLWQLIEDARSETGYDNDAAACDLLIRKLGICDHDGLRIFDDFFREQIETLNLPAVRDQARQHWTLSDESWLYLRAWIVSRGGEFFQAARTGPKHTMAVIAAEYPGLFNAPNGERFLHCVEEARRRLGPTDMRN